jgi:hypothetical protein
LAGLSWEEVMSRSLAESYHVSVLGHQIHLFDTGMCNRTTTTTTTNDNK